MGTRAAGATVLAAACLLTAGLSRAGAPAGASDSIRLNQIGFYPSASKIAVVTNRFR